MSDELSLNALTRSLMLGVSMGTITLTQVGCQQLPSPGSVSNETQAASPMTTEGMPQGEANLCARALETKSPNDVDAVLLQYPQSRCVRPLLSAMPAATLVALSPDAVSGIPRETLRLLPCNVLVQLPSVPTVRQATARATSCQGAY
jgi:hypothetical protein